MNFSHSVMHIIINSTPGEISLDWKRMNNNAMANLDGEIYLLLRVSLSKIIFHNSTNVKMNGDKVRQSSIVYESGIIHVACCIINTH